MSTVEASSAHLTISSLKWTDSDTIPIADRLPLATQGMTVLLGPSGAGKSTVLKGAMGWHEALVGCCELTINGNSVAMDSLNGAYLPQQSSDLHLPRYNVRQHLEIANKLRSHAKISDADINKLIELLDLSQKALSKPKALSGGMKQRLSFGMMMLRNADYLLLDEPFSGQDLRRRRALHAILLDNFNRDQDLQFVLMATHSIDDTIALGSVIWLIDNDTKMTGKVKSYAKKSEKINSTYFNNTIITSDDEWEKTVIDVFRNL